MKPRESKTRVIDKFYWGAYNRYLDGLNQSQETRQRIEQTVKLLVEQGAQPGERVLDAGCGTGLFTVALAQAGFRSTGVDFAPGVLKRAQRRSQEAGAAAEFEKIDLDNHFWFADQHFDHAICISVLHLVGRPEWALQEFRRVIRPGGKLIISLWRDLENYRTAYPDIFKAPPSPSERVQKLLNRAVKTANKVGERRQRVRFWSEAEFKSMLERAGFNVVQLEGAPLMTAVAVVEKLDS